MKKIKVAQIRGDGLSDRETQTWKYFSDDIQQTVFAAKKNIYSQSPLPYPIITLGCSSDNFLTKNLYKYFFGQYKRMFGLEKKLADFDIAHVGELYNYYTYQAVAAKKINKKLKVVATVWENSFGRFEYNYWPGFSIPPRYWRDKLQNIMRTNAEGVDMFVPATQDAAELLIDCGVSEKKITVVTPGILPIPEDTKQESTQLFAGKEVYLMVNRMVKEKGVYDVLYAWRRYLSKSKNNYPKILVMIGDGPERRNILRIIQEWGLSNQITCIRQLPYQEMLGLYKGAKCLLLASIPQATWQEQFGYVLAEAICADVPIIATYCGAIPEVVGNAGLLVTPGHPVALSDALLKLEDKIVYQGLKDACKNERNNFLPEEYARKVSKIYYDLADL